MKKDIIVGLGEALWDLLPDGKKIGGAPANFAYHTSQFGFEGWVISSVGSDELGDEIVEILTEKGLNLMLERSEAPTGSVKVTLSDDGIPQYEICNGVAWDNISYSQSMDELASRAKCVVFGSLAQRNEISRNSIQRFVAKVGERKDTMRIFDINLRQNFYNKEMISKSLELCNILKINDEELEIVAKMFNLDDSDIELVCKKIIDIYSLEMLILTCGAVGSYIFYRDEKSYIETPRVEVADTVGAGDSFTATFAASLMRGDSIAKAHALAVKVAAYVCTQSGAMPPTARYLQNELQ